MATKKKLPTGETFGARLRAARARAGLSLDALAKLGPITKTNLVKWEHDRTEPRTKNVTAVAHILGVAPEWLQYGEGDPSGDARERVWETYVNGPVGRGASAAELDEQRAGFEAGNPTSVHYLEAQLALIRGCAPAADVHEVAALNRGIDAGAIAPMRRRK